MTTKSDVLGQLRREWECVGRSSVARRALGVLDTHHPELALAPFNDLCDIVRLLERGGGRDVLERAAIVKALLEESTDPSIRRALFQTLLPGVVSVCRQLRFGDGIVAEPSDTLAMALALASELLTDWAGQSRQYAAPDLLSALRGRLRRQLMKEKAALRAVSFFDAADDPAIEQSPLLARLASFQGSRYERLAQLTYARVFEGRSLRDLAGEDHSAPRSLQAELQHFAIRHLL